MRRRSYRWSMRSRNSGSREKRWRSGCWRRLALSCRFEANRRLREFVPARILRHSREHWKKKGPSHQLRREAFCGGKRTREVKCSAQVRSLVDISWIFSGLIHKYQSYHLITIKSMEAKHPGAYIRTFSHRQVIINHLAEIQTV